MFEELLRRCPVQEVARDESVERCHRGIIDALNPTTDASFLNELDAGLEIVHQDTDLVRIQIVHCRDGLVRIKSLSSKNLAHVSPILLLDVGVVVL